ncbi:MAG: hypothetical protein GYA02_08345 [Clostridiaceae bacterium]|nr:hypothetical protein [Clostridiaceae bacterium]
MENSSETIRYKWNEEIGNYCLARGYDFIYPLKPIKLSEMNLSKTDFATTLQSIYYKKTGKIISTLGFDYEKDIETAKELGCWD